MVSKKISSLYFICIIFIGFTFFISTSCFSQIMPPFKMQLTNGRLFTSVDIPTQKPVIIIYFSPDCEHCQKLMNEIFHSIQSFKKAELILVSFFPVDKLKAFESQYQTAKYNNIVVGTEIPVFYFRKYYQLEHTPFIALFNKHGKMIVSYKEETPVAELIKHIPKS